MNNPSQRGFALLIVLWAIALLAFLATQLLTAARSQTQQIANDRVAAVGQAALQGAIYEAAFHVLDDDPGQHWAADQTPHTVRDMDGTVIRIGDESEKVNINTASPELLQALLLQLGIDQRQSSALTASIVAWRNPVESAPFATELAAPYREARLPYAPAEHPFRRLEDLSLVIGMTPGLARIIIPHVTIWSDYGPGPDTHDSAVRRAWQQVHDAGGDLPVDQNLGVTRVLTISARSGESRARTVVVRLDPSNPGEMCTLLAWLPS